MNPITAVPAECRVHDLLAKCAGVSLGDTARVLQALASLSAHLDQPMSVLALSPVSLDRPSASQEAACDRAFAALPPGTAVPRRRKAPLCRAADGARS
jgi:hypothetical protein